MKAGDYIGLFRDTNNRNILVKNIVVDTFLWIDNTETIWYSKGEKDFNKGHNHWYSRVVDTKTKYSKPFQVIATKVNSPEDALLITKLYKFVSEV